ncbi:MAG TPA: cyclase family protein [Streptosporangiaceae bacterium]
MTVPHRDSVSPVPRQVARAEFDAIFASCSNQGRWGADDERGALNFITDREVASGARLVRDGATIGCGWPLDTTAGPDNPRPALHHMTKLADVHRPGSPDLRTVGDFLGIEFHGDAHSHIDALCHVVYRGSLYNGVPAQGTITSQGARKQAIDIAGSGIVSRGVLLDVPLLRGTRWVRPGEAISPAEFLAAEAAAGTQLRQGDVALLRTGHARRRLEAGPWHAAESKAGLDVAVMPILHERRVAAIGFDGDGEAVPTPVAGVRSPVHAIGIAAMGLHFLDSLLLEDLARACAERRRWQFLFVVAPLRLAGGTGSPVNPIAIL